MAKDLEYTDRIEFILTFDGSENKYSKSLYEKYKDLKIQNSSGFKVRMKWKNYIQK